MVQSHLLLPLLFSFIHSITKGVIVLSFVRYSKKFKSKSLISLEIHANRVQLQQAYCELPSSAIVDGVIQEPEQVKSALQHVIEKTGLKGSDVAIVLPSQCIFSKIIQLPIVLLDHECEIEIHSKLYHYFPSIKEKLYFDFANLNTQATQNKEKKFREVLLVVSPQVQVETYIDIVNQCGLKVKVVEIEGIKEINLLPWRSSQKIKQKMYQKIIFGIGALAILFVLIFSLYYFHAEKVKRIAASSVMPVKLKQHRIKQKEYKTIGYLLGEGCALGLVKAMNGKTITVEVGSVLANNLRVVRIDETGVVVKRNGLEERL